jgi:hypothetical protein
MTYYSRSDWGARHANGGPGKLSPVKVEGIALHWPAMSRPLRDFASVAAALRGWQNYHMDDLGWSDIGYQEAIDQNGNVYELRGILTQSGANGNQDVNQRFGALLLILAPGEKPSPAMLGAVQGRIKTMRFRYPRAKRIVGHNEVRPEATACPGPITQDLIKAGAFEPRRPAEKTRGVMVDRALNAVSRAYRRAEKKGRSRRARVLNEATEALKKLKARRKR